MVSPVSVCNLVFCLHASIQPITSLIIIAFLTHWLTDAYEINSLGFEIWYRMTGHCLMLEKCPGNSVCAIKV